MQDGIIKGTGNSRLLKGAGWPSTYAEFKAMAEAGTLPIDLAGINSAGWQQIGTALSKGNLLSDTTAAKYFASPVGTETVDQVLSLLGTYNQYWWKRRSTDTTYEISVQPSGNNVFITNDLASTSTSLSVEYSSSVTVNSAGVISLVSPSTVSVSYDTYTTANILKGKYFKDYTGVIWFCNSSATISRQSGYDVYVSAPGCSSVTSVEVYPDWEYIQSSSSSLYPQSGTQDGYEYAYLGKPLDNAVTAPKIATGSYTGTGTYGAANKNSLTAPFDIKLAIIMSANGNVLILMNAVTKTYPLIGGGNNWGGSQYAESVAWGTNTVSWYNTFSDTYQLNFGANKYILVG